jgi:Glycosyltransferases involved in cell wall biogenesis
MISIITPVYNAAPHIERFLESVIAQTFKDVEVLIIDDHGSDNSIRIAHAVTDAYSGPINFRYFATSENSGPGVARNLGISEAAGEYVAFVDSDDFITPDFCQLLYSSARKNGSDLVCCDTSICDSSGRPVEERGNQLKDDGEFTGKRRKAFLSTYISFFSTFLYRKDLFDKYSIHFPSGRSAEDSAMLCCALLCCRRISKVNKSLYCIVRNENSLTMMLNPTRYQQRLDSMRTLMDIVRTRGWYWRDQKEIDYIYFKKGYMMSVFDYIANNKPVSRAVLGQIRKELMEIVPDYHDNHYLREHFAFRTLDTLLTKAPLLAVWIIKTYVKTGACKAF